MDNYTISVLPTVEINLNPNDEIVIQKSFDLYRAVIKCVDSKLNLEYGKKYKITSYDKTVSVWINFSNVIDREDGPAVEDENNTAWVKLGKLHRDDGPAVINSNKSICWYLNGISYTFDQYIKIAKISLDDAFILKLKWSEYKELYYPNYNN